MAWGNPVEKTGAKYLVCSHCMKEGKQSWIYEDRVQFRPFCVNCGQAWGDIGPIQRTRPRGLRRVRRQSRPNGAKDDPSRANPRKPRASDAEEALAQIWDDLPDAVRTAVKDAGWTPDSPPGLGFSQIRGDSSDHSQTAAAELYKQADEETKKLLKMAGVSEPEGPPPTTLQAVHQANKAYQKHTADLRQLVLRRVTLQSKCDKAKLAYEAMCREVKTLSDDIAAKETEVAKAHLLIKTKAAVPAPPPLLRMSEVLKKAGVELTDDQIKSIEEQIQEPVVEAPTDLNPVGPRTLGLVLDATEMDVDEVEVLQKKLDEVRDRAKRKREVSPPPSQAHFLPSDPGAHPSGPTSQTHMPPNPPLVLGPKEPPKDKSQNDAAGL